MICQSLDLSSCHPRGSNVNNPWAQAEPSTQPFISLLLSVPGTGAFVFSLRPETLQELHGKDLLSFSFCLCEQLRLTGWGQEKVQLRGVCCSVRPSREGMLFPSVLAAAIWKKKKKHFSWTLPRSPGSLSKQLFLWMLAVPWRLPVSRVGYHRCESESSCEKEQTAGLKGLLPQR